MTYFSEESSRRCKELLKEIERLQQLIQEKDTVHDKREIRVQNLEQQLRALEHKHQEELRHKQRFIQSLQSELIEKSDQIAQLQMAPLTGRPPLATAASLGKPLTTAVVKRTVSASSADGVRPASRVLVDQFFDMDLRSRECVAVTPPHQKKMITSPGSDCSGNVQLCASGGVNDVTSSSTVLEPHVGTTSSFQVPISPSSLLNTNYRPPSCDDDELLRFDDGSPPASMYILPGHPAMPMHPSTTICNRPVHSPHRSHRRRPHLPSHITNEVLARPPSAKKMDMAYADIAQVDTEEILQIAREQRVHLKMSAAKAAAVASPSKGAVAAAASGPQIGAIPPIRQLDSHMSQPELLAASAAQPVAKILPSSLRKVERGAAAIRGKSRGRPASSAVETLAVDNVISPESHKSHRFKNSGADS